MREVAVFSRHRTSCSEPVMDIVPLDNIAHGGLRLRNVRGPASGDPSGLVAIMPGEFVAVQREYPILFRRQEGGPPLPVALLGLAPDDNLFIADGRWQARYIPALARRGPLLIGRGTGEDMAVHVDLGHAALAGAGEDGAALFLPHGGHAPALEAALEALRQVHGGQAELAAMGEVFARLGLSEPLPLHVRVTDDQAVNLAGFEAITPEAIAGLPESAIATLRGAGFLDHAVLAAHSLGNLNALAQLHRAKSA